MRLLGLDLGFAALGYVVVEAETVLVGGVIRTKKTAKKRGIRVADDDMMRAQEIVHELNRIARENGIGAVVAELPSGGAKGARAHLAMGMAKGVLAAWLVASRFPCEFVTPDEVKRAVTGKRNASKIEVEEAVKRLYKWPCPFVPKRMDAEHIADAAGAVYAAREGNMMRTLEARTV